MPTWTHRIQLYQICQKFLKQMFKTFSSGSEKNPNMNLIFTSHKTFLWVRGLYFWQTCRKISAQWLRGIAQFPKMIKSFTSFSIILFLCQNHDLDPSNTVLANLPKKFVPKPRNDFVESDKELKTFFLNIWKYHLGHVDFIFINSAKIFPNKSPRHFCSGSEKDPNKNFCLSF